MYLDHDDDEAVTRVPLDPAECLESLGFNLGLETEDR